MSAEPNDARGFDPTRYLTKVSGRDYLEVKWRIVWFREVHPDGSIVTEMAQHQNQSAVFKATVSWPTETGIVTCSDWGSEGADDFGDYLEKASTKAIGRALALAGFGTQFAGDHEFGADQQRVVDSPVNIRSGRTQARQRPDNRKYAHAAANAMQDDPQGDSGRRTMNPANANEPATEAQIRAIFGAGKRIQQWGPDETKQWVADNFGGKHIDALSRAEASQIIDHLNEPVAAGGDL